MAEEPTRLTYDDYTVGWVAVLHSELTAARLLLDNEHERLDPAPGDPNSYILGEMAGHNVVLASPGAGRKGECAATLATVNMIRTFEKIRFGLLVGTAGGAPKAPHHKDPRKDIRLGDVVVSCPVDGDGGGVLQVDYGKRLQPNEFKLTGHRNKPPVLLLTGVETLRSDHSVKKGKMHDFIGKVAERSLALDLEGYLFPGWHNDLLFNATYRHRPPQEPENEASCSSCDVSQAVTRLRRKSEHPVVHHGIIASGNQVVRSAEYRDLLRDKHRILCFEMEASGLVDAFPCLVIRGISDYSDDHKNKLWQPYAATTAAAYARDLLQVVKPTTVRKQGLVPDLAATLGKVSEEVAAAINIAQAKTDSQETQRHLERATVAEANLVVAEEHLDIFVEQFEQQKYKLPLQRNALHDSEAVSRHTPLCHPDTRKDILKVITEWAESDNGETIFWLHGPAGTGKSTISRTVAHNLVNADPASNVQLGASYFFKAPDRSSSSRLFSTISSRLMHAIPQLARYVRDSLGHVGWLDEDDIEGKDRQQQFEALILNPVKNCQSQHPSTRTSIIVIDGLDECEKKDIPAICTQLARLRELRAARLRVLITTRSQNMIGLAFRGLQDARSVSLLDSTETKADIERFLGDSFGEMKLKRGISQDWPSGDDLNRVISLATTPSPLFIYAATLCRHVVGGMRGNPVRRLEYWLSEHQQKAFQLDEQINQMYRAILQEAQSGLDRHEKQLLEEILGVVVLLATPLPAASIASFLNVDEADVNFLFPDLHAVIDVRPGGPVEVVHESFRDFLLSHNRALQEDAFRVDAAATYMKLVQKCIDRMKGTDHGPRRGLRRNMYSFKDYGEAIDGVADTIREIIPLDLEYTCINWVYHLQDLYEFAERSRNEERKAGFRQKILELLQEVQPFVEDHFLHWIEALCLLGKLSKGLLSIRQLQSLVHLHSGNGSPFARFLSDAERFIVSYGSIIEQSPLQIYCAALAFYPTDSEVCKRYLGERYPDVPIPLQAAKGGSLCLQTLKGHSGSITSVSFSRDGALLASAANDGTVRLWDGSTGAFRRTLEQRNSYVLAAAFSHDSKILATASSDLQVRLWDIDSSAEIESLGGHSDWVNAIAFSPSKRNGNLLASGSSDGTVQLWNIDAEDKHLLSHQGRSDVVNAVAFSRDSRMLASASSDGRIRLLDTETCTLMRVLEGHSSSILAVDFSPDCKKRTVASATADGLVRLWDIDTGDSQHLQSLEDARCIDALAFSHDGSMLAMAASDRMVWIWGINQSTYIKTLEGHEDCVNTVAFSPDDRVLSSASSDGTVRIWDIKKNTTIETPKPVNSQNVMASLAADKTASGSSGHKPRNGASSPKSQRPILDFHAGPVNAVAFSPEGAVLASASSDRTIRLWDSNTGEHRRTLEGHRDRILAITFSPDGKLLASASSDETIRLWDSGTGIHQRTLAGLNGSILAIAFSPDGSELASASTDWRVRIWDVSNGALKQELAGHRDWVTAVAFSPDGKLVASASRDGVLRVWDIDQKAQDLRFSSHTSKPVPATSTWRIRHCVAHSEHSKQVLPSAGTWIRTVGFSPDGKVLASATSDGIVRLLDVNHDSLQKPLDFAPGYETAVAFSLDGRVLEAEQYPSGVPSTSKRKVNEQMSSLPLPSESGYFERLWEFIRGGIDQIMHLSDGGINLETYMHVYTAIHHYCARRDAEQSNSSGNQDSQLQNEGARSLYTKLGNYVTEHVKRLVAISQDHSDDEILTFYLKEWNRYSMAAKYVHHLFRALNRMYVMPEWERGNKTVHDVYILHLVRWRAVLFESVWLRVIDAVLKLVEKHRNGESVNHRQIRLIVDSFIYLGIDDENTSRPTLDVLRYRFEKPYLMATREFYQLESRQLIGSDSIEYMKKVERHLQEEEERVQMYLHPDIALPVMRVCTAALVGDHADALRATFHRLLNDGREQDMARMFNLLSRVPRGLDPLLSKFGARLQKAGLQTVLRAASDADKLEPKVFVGTVHAQHQGLFPWTRDYEHQFAIDSGGLGTESTSGNASYSNDAVSISEDWIARGGRNLLCLPPDYRATCTAFSNNILVLGHRSGQVTFLRFPIS